MAIPVYVGASAGQIILTGTATVAKTGCIAGNVVVLHLMERGAPSQRTVGGDVNILKMDGTAGHNTLTSGSEVGGSGTGRHNIYCGRVAANGTVSIDCTVGASGFDLLGRWYEFSGVTTAAGAGDATAIFENGAGLILDESRTNATLFDANVTTTGADRLAVNFFALEGVISVPVLTGQTGGTWVEPVAEYAEASGATGTLAIQTADIAVAGTISGGEATITSTGQGCIGSALKSDVADNVTVNVSVNF